MPSNSSHPLPRAGLWLALTLACQTSGSAGGIDNGGEEENTAPEGKALPAGTWGRAPHFEMRVSIPEDCAPGPEAHLDEHTRRVSVEVTLRATGKVQVPANPYYALLVDSARDVYEASLVPCEHPLPPSLLQMNQAADGAMFFDIPRTSTGLELVYAPALAGAPRPELVFDLGPE